MAADDTLDRLVSLDPVLTQATMGPSPVEERQAIVQRDQGILDRLAQAEASGPTVRQRTQSEIIDLTLLQNRLGNPFSTRWIPFEQLREMTTDLMLAFGWWMTVTPLIRAEWSIASPDAQLAAAVDEALRPVITSDILAMSNALWFGHQPLVKRFKLGKLGGFYRDPQSSDPDADIPVWNSSADALLWKAPAVLNPAHCLPQWDDEGQMVGFKFSQTPIPHFDLISAASAYGYEVIPGHFIGPDFAMWITNESELQFGSIFGSARTKRAYPYWWSYWFRWRLADRSYENLADPAKIVYYPVDFDRFIDPDDPDAENPRVRMARQTALDLGAQTRSGATLAVPGSMHEGHDGKSTGMRKWELSYLQARNNFSDLDSTFKMLDTLKLRSWFIPEQAFIEGCLLASTPILCPRDHGTYPDGIPLGEISTGQLIWSYNERNEQFELWPVRSVHKTKTDLVFKVTLDDGSEIVGTPEHPFLKRDGTWVDLQDLRPGDSLMPLYEKTRDRLYNGVPCNPGDCEPYAAVVPGGAFTPEFRLVGDHFGWTRRGGGFAIHHKDERHANSSPENLQFLSSSEHQKVHLSDPTRVQYLRQTGREAIDKLKATMTPDEWKDYCSDRTGKGWANGRARQNWRSKNCRACEAIFAPNSAAQVYCDNCSPKKQPRYTGRIKSERVYAPKSCVDCGEQFSPTSPPQKRCPGCASEYKEKTYGPKYKAPSNHKVVSVEFAGIHDVWDIEMDAPDWCCNFVAAGVVVHNSGGKTAGGSGGGSGGARMATQLGQVYEESQQLLVNQYDEEINEFKIPQFIAANFPEKVGTPCRKVSRSLGVLDDQTRSQLLQLIGQVRGEVLPVDTRKLLEDMNVPLLNKVQMQQEIEQISKLQQIMGPPPMQPETVGMQGYNAGVEKSEKGNFYYQPRQRIILAEHGDFMRSLPETPHYSDVAVRSLVIRLRKLFVERYEGQYKSFVDFLKDKPTLHLAQDQQQHGLSKKQAAASAAAIITMWASLIAPGAPGHPTQVVAPGAPGEHVAQLVGKIAMAGGKNALKGARLATDEFGDDTVQPWVESRVKFAIDSIDQTVRQELQTWLEAELQKTVDPASIAAAAEEHFEQFPDTHADRATRTEAVDAFNHGTLAALHLAGVAQVQAHDASDGTDLKTDAECIARNGRVYTIDEAMQEPTHPNDTLYWTPLATTALSVERVDELPEHLAGIGRNVAYDSRTETLFLTTAVLAEQEQAFMLMLGDELKVS